MSDFAGREGMVMASLNAFIHIQEYQQRNNTTYSSKIRSSRISFLGNAIFIKIRADCSSHSAVYREDEFDKQKVLSFDQ